MQERKVVLGQGHYNIKSCMPFDGLVPVRLLLSSLAVLYQVKAESTFLNSLRKNDVEGHVEFMFKVMERAGVACTIDVSFKKDSLLVYLLNVFGSLVGRCGSVVVRE